MTNAPAAQENYWPPALSVSVNLENSDSSSAEMLSTNHGEMGVGGLDADEALTVTFLIAQ